ncbi:FAD:protein FMN transferase [Dyadobacter sp. 3J3]|uniref:FAD:protein FMN transferase n=1 Tax=Dyadobacter sp. 3J3 TaxID=2606600 RepID=UPI001356CE10|nr:FAD:protein FMN transferase [Dyadobacter sp. 3J3]
MADLIVKRSLRLMGNRFEISAVSGDELWANQRIDQAVGEIQRIEQLLSTFREDSQTQLINNHAGIRPVAVDYEVYALIERSIRISELTQGAFDITYGSIDKSLWNFDLNMQSLPTAEVAKNMVRLINYKNIVLDAEHFSVFLKEEGMRIGFGGIGKGYAAEMAKKIMQENGVKGGVVNASGDLTAWGKQPDGSEWTIGIADPDSKNKPFSYLKISDMAVATSGNYEKFILIDGKKYSHTINPKTGLPVTGIKSVTIISPNAELSDALATPVTVLGVTVGLDLINQMKNIACIIVDDHNRLFSSKNIKIS